jgi:hypothetical protein
VFFLDVDSGYIIRLRGYHTQTNLIQNSNNNKNDHDIDEKVQHEEGRLPHSYYYAMIANKAKLHDYWPIKQAFYAREFPTSWRNLDFDVAD